MATAKSPKQSPASADRDPVADEPPPRLPFSIVAIGASAGGLEAFIDFIKAVPSDSGLAYVFIQHLPPEHESLLPEILAHHTTIPVLEITEGLRAEPDHVYTIRPGHTLTIDHGAFHLGESVDEPARRRPVDDFFRSLAQEQRERAIAVVLSGMGSNGTAGAQVIKVAGGLCLAQDPDAARFPSMPQHLIDAGYADFVLPPGEMPEVLRRYAGHPYARGTHVPELNEGHEQPALQEILALLRQRIRHDFSGYKRSTLLRRIERRMGLAQITTLGDYLRRLVQKPAELRALADDFMIHVTGFFRDADTWQTLYEQVLLPLARERPDRSSLRAWVTACSSGEEAYTLAMLLVEAAEAAGKRFDIKIFATDTAESSLSHARAGRYRGGIESEVSRARLERFFDLEDALYRVKPELREMVVFAPQNILQDPPFSRLDLCTCRNFLIYLEPDAQRRVLSLIHFGLHDGGTLLLGNSETISHAEDLFEPIDKIHRIFRRIGPARHGLVEFPIGTGQRKPYPTFEPHALSRTSLPQLVHRVLLDRYSPAAVVVDREQHIVYFHGRTDRYLEQPRGEPTRELLLLARETIRSALRTALQQSFATHQPVVARDGMIEEPTGRCWLEIAVCPLEAAAHPAYFLVSFHERPEPPPAIAPGQSQDPEAQRRLEEELQHARDNLQSIIQELQASNEELKASNEEATSINEELQSTNEELETSKEELQSLNEELTTVNAQLQAKMEELESTTNDLTSLLTSTDIAVVFLDTRFRIRRYTPVVSDLFELIPSDVGRPLNDLARKFRDDDLNADVQSVLDRLVPVEREIESNSGRIYMRRVLPYRTTDNRIDGVVITFVDISARRRAEAALSVSEDQNRLILDGIRTYAIFMLDLDGRIATWNPGAERVLGYTQSEIVGRMFEIFFTDEDRAAGLPRHEIEHARKHGSIVQEGWRVRRDGTRLWGSGQLTALHDRAGQPRGFVKLLRDDTIRKTSEEALRSAKRAAEAANEAKDQFLANVSHELRTPLSAMVLWTSLIEDEKVTDPQQLAEGLAAIRRSAEEQRNLIEDLVDTARIVAGKLRLEFKDADLAAVVRAAVEANRPAATGKNLTLTETLDPVIGAVRADPARLQQVVSNLVDNAVKFTPPGGRIAIALQRVGPEVHISVADTGIGIAPEFLPTVFDRFTQAEMPGAAPRGGLGLGLAIVRQIVEMHNGSISVESPGLGQGATFTVRLLLPAIAAGARTIASGTKNQLAGLLTGRHVLLVEDVAATRRALVAVLEQAGADVVGVDSATAGWDHVQRRRPDLIVSDLGLPMVDGYAFMYQLRATENSLRTPPIPAVALTAFAGENVNRKALESGYQVCLTKPIEPLRLAKVLQSLVAPNKA